MSNGKADERLNRLLESCGHTLHSHLYYLGDKQLFWDTKHEAVIAYRSLAKRNIALGDPVGSPEASRRVIKQFISYCRKQNRIPVFYQAKSRHLPLYTELGLHNAKIGEEAQVDLTRFHMNGKPWLKMRNRVSKFERGGYSVKVLMPPFNRETLQRLQAISDEWLSSRKEKSFSVGSFSPDYVSRFPVAVLIGPDGRYEAFATIAGDAPAAESADGNDGSAACRHITVDLMRYTAACPHGTMDYLFISLFRWAKERGYATCSLGVAPLANMDHLLFVRLLCKYGSKLYNFKGLYDYKNKFAPDWKDIYLICPSSTVPVTIGVLAYMIHSPAAPLSAEQDGIKISS